MQLTCSTIVATARFFERSASSRRDFEKHRPLKQVAAMLLGPAPKLSRTVLRQKSFVSYSFIFSKRLINLSNPRCEPSPNHVWQNTLWLGFPEGSFQRETQQLA